MTKAETRKHISSLRPDEQTLKDKSPLIVEKLQALPLFQKAKTIGSYIPLPDEVDTSPLFHFTDKSFCIPAFDKEAGEYRMAKWVPDLKPGKFNIPEPANPVWAETDDLNLILEYMDGELEGKQLEQGSHLTRKGTVWDAAADSTTACCPNTTPCVLVSALIFSV